MSHEIHPCHDLGRGCVSYRPGHHLHFIHAKHLGQSPWGWRDGVVVAVDGRHVEVDYVVAEGRAMLWHHQPLDGLVGPDALVRVHEELHALGGPFGWLDVAIVSGIGPVPLPEDTSAWAGERRIAVTDVRSGRAVAVDHLGSPGPRD